MIAAVLAGDSFWTLEPLARAGTLGVAAVTALVALAAVRALRAPRPARLLWATAVLWLHLWLSPQAFYEWYRVALGPLPAQWVADAPGPGRLLRTLLLAQEASLSRLSQGLLGWALLAVGWRGSGRSPASGDTP